MNRRGFMGMLVGAAVTPFLPVKPLFEPGEAMFFLPRELKLKARQTGITYRYVEWNSLYTVHRTLFIGGDRDI